MATLSDKNLADWLEQVADGLDAGLQASNAVGLAKRLPADKSDSLEAAFQNGEAWGDSLEFASLSLSYAELSILKASDLSGRLPVAMRRIATARRERAKVKRRMMLALAYPLFLLHFAALVFSITYLVDGDVSAFFVSAGMVIVPVWLLILFLVAGARLFPGSATSVMRYMPFFSGYRWSWEVGTMCEVLAAGFAAGMNVRQTWEIAAKAADSPKLYRLTDAMLEAISNGNKVSQAIANCGKRAPKGLAQLYRSGEETGTLAENLDAAAKRYFADAKSRLVLASVAYPTIVLLGIFGYVGYKIVSWFGNYYDELSKING
ncbi:type II secretion system F family protein [Pelagicoccus sp. SDUM812002]|uniref:type II secretion system F family protein n=1 Tax=Pelagicoccus sp. SDUM812002 TaxID=3041266 RepID=UPI00280D1585|nr:type II secretion system F family protein [Pelagicoccus sp. SDUM812002]MDQ8184156.1 type II secretion system F family protein [Pelagicoccus sp. SDUM812002]